jgi:hypothetical protein
MIKKSAIYLFAAIFLICLLICLLTDRSPFGGKNTSFTSAPKIEITRIEFSENGKILILEKKMEHWLVNGRLETRKTSIQFIIKILTEMEIKSPVNTELFNDEIIEQGIDPVKVKVYEKGRIIKSFLVYKTTSNNYGNIMKLRENSKPFIVHVPGNEVEIGSAFTLNELFWQPYIVFALLPSEVFAVTLESIKDPSSSFSIRNENGRFKLYGNSGELSGWDTSRLIRYISYFTHVPFESWDFDLSDVEKKNIRKEAPLYKITVVNSLEERKVLSLWERYSYENGFRKADTDRLWAQKEGFDEIFIIRYIDIDPLLKKQSYFYPE